MVGCVMPVEEKLHLFTLNDEENEKGMKFIPFQLFITLSSFL